MAEQTDYKSLPSGVLRPLCQVFAVVSVLIGGVLIFQFRAFIEALVFPAEKLLGKKVFTYQYFAAYCDYWYPVTGSSPGYEALALTGLLFVLVAAFPMYFLETKTKVKLGAIALCSVFSYLALEFLTGLAR